MIVPRFVRQGKLVKCLSNVDNVSLLPNIPLLIESTHLSNLTENMAYARSPPNNHSVLVEGLSGTGCPWSYVVELL